MRVANAFESSSTALFLGFSMQKPGLIGGLRMIELVSERAEVDHNYLSETSKRACLQAFRGCRYRLPYDQFHCNEITSQDKSEAMKLQRITC